MHYSVKERRLANFESYSNNNIPINEGPLYAMRRIGREEE
jgi:hypothetical protein